MDFHSIFSSSILGSKILGSGVATGMIESTTVSTVQDALCVLGVSVIALPAIIFSMLLHRQRFGKEISLKENARRSFLREFSILPGSTIRRFLKPKTVQELVDVPRFRERGDQLCMRVVDGLCSGYWICKGPPGRSQRPKDSDIVLLWIHGGAYCFGDPLGAALTLLRVAERAAEQRVSISIFTVEYTLAPFARFPLQQNEAVAAYRYLLEVEKIEASNVIIAGESAGGHLSLSCLLALAEAKLPKPLGALLLFPWVNLKNSAPSFRANKNKDVLNKYLLDRCVDLVVGKDRNMNTPAREILDLTKPLSDGRLWSHVLPMHSWINVGSHDIFLDDVRHFVQQVRADGAVVDLEIAYGEPHGWQFTANESSFNHYCSLQPDQDVPPGMMPGSENILKGAFAILRSCGRIEESLA